MMLEVVIVHPLRIAPGADQAGLAQAEDVQAIRLAQQLEQRLDTLAIVERRLAQFCLTSGSSGREDDVASHMNRCLYRSVFILMAVDAAVKSRRFALSGRLQPVAFTR
jgi:hypothetical protein